MISVDLKGGIGNQLFQIMATVAHSIRTNIPFMFPRDKFKDEGPNRPTYWTTIFRHLEPYLNTHFNTQINSKDIEAYTPVCNNDHYAPIPHRFENTLLKGYYQDPQYFEDVYAQALEITGIPEVRKEVLSKHISDPAITISMHFRRGDYCQLRCYHPVLTEYYYMNALLHMMKYLHYDTTSRIKVVCFYEESDQTNVMESVNKIREILDAGSYTNIEYVTDKYRDLADWEQLLVMSGCDHHIIANSTFSWWAAYLNPSVNKIVCYPDYWVGHQLYYMDMKGFQVEGWHSINAFDVFKHKCNC